MEPIYSFCKEKPGWEIVAYVGEPQRRVKMKTTEEMIDAMTLYGYLSIKNHSSAAYLYRETRRWIIDFEIRLGDRWSVSITCKDEEFPMAIEDIYKDSLAWMVENYPQYVLNGNVSES